MFSKRRILSGLLSFAAATAVHAAPAARGHVVLVLPFDNRSGQTGLNWIGDSFPEMLNQRLSSSGFLTISRDDRMYALDHLGYPLDLKPTRATALRIAQTLDADLIVIGSFTMQDDRIAAQAQVLDVSKLSMSRPLEDSVDKTRFFDLENAIAWKVVRQVDPSFPVAEQTFLAQSAGDKLEAFESYVRGVSAQTPSERLKRLKTAVSIAPDYAAAILALGKAQYAQGQFEDAAATLGKLPQNNRLALEANFYLGLASFNSGQYPAAEKAFEFVASRLPLPEVVNNQAVSASRQGKDAGALFQRASAADPKDADYHYNVATALFQRRDLSGARAELQKTLSLRPNDAEAPLLLQKIDNPSADFEPLPRIRRTYSETGFRQAAYELEEMRAMQAATLPPAKQSEALVQQGIDYLQQGLVLEAEREFQAAVQIDPASAAAHTGLAQVRERSGNAADARTEAEASLKLKPNAAAYLVLARMELATNQLPQAANDVSNALRLEPANAAAIALKQTIASRSQAAQ
ncbi:tetratricopeptide repeat protein [Terriglobus tenax]|uniref:tetratricopeptide repeat protein n=1 Tax=Terriglobus tenax TaxID=1111115 RepID=UPI0021DF47A2|nr:tetratricopeptide repeat protein [Terriglobus tenax]